MMMNDEQKLAPSGFANAPSIVPNYTANRRGARIDTRPATDCPWRWATHEGPMLCLVHTHPPTERKGGRVPDSDENQISRRSRRQLKQPKHTCLDYNENESASGTVPTSDRHGSTHLLSFFGGLSLRSFVSLKRPKIAVATCKLASNQKAKEEAKSAGRARTSSNLPARRRAKKTRQSTSRAME